MKTIHQDPKSNNLTLNEATDAAQKSESSTLETDVYVWRYALLVVLASSERITSIRLGVLDWHYKPTQGVVQQ